MKRWISAFVLAAATVGLIILNMPSMPDKEISPQETNSSEENSGETVVRDGYTGLASSGDGWCYLENGVFRDDYNGLILYNDVWWCVEKGWVNQKYTGLWNDPTLGWWYVEDGMVNLDYSGLAKYQEDMWGVSDGQAMTDYTGLWNDPARGWWYLEKGRVNKEFSGLVEYENLWWCVSEGKAAVDFTGIWNDPEYGWWYVENGSVNKQKTGLVEYGENWWCVSEGRVATDYTGLWNDTAYGWWYVKKGMVDFDYNGTAEYGGKTWHIKDGTVDWDYQEPKKPEKENSYKVLVAYFSCTGTTRTIAEYIADEINADLFRIVPVEPYSEEDLKYNSDSRADREQADLYCRPAIAGKVDDLSKYDIVFIGYPIWHGQAPRIIATFLESYDFSGKIIVPFCTSYSSGIGSSAENLYGLTGESTSWVKGMRFSDSSDRLEVAKWLESIGFDVSQVTSPDSGANYSGVFYARRRRVAELVPT